MHASTHASEETIRYSLQIVIALAIKVSTIGLPFRTRASTVGIAGVLYRILTFLLQRKLLCSFLFFSV